MIEKPWKDFLRNISLMELNSFELCRNENLSESFFEKFPIDELNWVGLSGNPNLPESFFEKHIDKVHLYSLCKNTMKNTVMILLKLIGDIYVKIKIYHKVFLNDILIK